MSSCFTTTSSKGGSHISCSSNTSSFTPTRRSLRRREEDTTGHKAPRISRWALQELADFCNSQVQTPELTALPQIPLDELEMRDLLGEGGFASVYEVFYDNTAFALKQIRRQKQGRKVEDWIMAVFDLCNEATILGKVAPHENIVSIRGVCQASVSEAYKSHPNGWFFLEEKLQETLANRLKGWSRELKTKRGRLSLFRNRRHSSPSTLVDPSRPIGEQLLSVNQVHDRLQDVALGIANAMTHLHSESFQIVVRDLKPQNIGFDEHGVVKLFDLGMARPLHEAETAVVAGTFRYLCPEALMGKPISLESDVYSFGIILYELVTLANPFEQFYQRGKLVRKDAFVDQVVVAGWRPDLSDIPCRATARLIGKCWDPSPRARPSFERIHKMLLHILANRESTTTIMTTSLHSTLSSKPDVADDVRDDKIIAPYCDHQHPLSSSRSDPSTTPQSTANVRGLFRGLKPLSRLKKRACSDNTVSTSVGSSGNMIGDDEE